MDGEFGYRPRRGEGEGAFPEDPSPERLTELIREASQGRSEALERLFRRIVPELKELARTQLARESGVPDLRPTALINEMFLRLFRSPPQFADSDHFFRIVSRTMGRILIDRAKAAKRLKRGAGRRP
ncbi:MAG: hypothetical protein KDC38_13115, partial [Planctomycetes bacterium]|nr:hypothetical protein [Planctomycetota bacterium]